MNEDNLIEIEGCIGVSDHCDGEIIEITQYYDKDGTERAESISMTREVAINMMNELAEILQLEINV